MAESVRAFWNGHLRLALATIPVRLVSAGKGEAPKAVPKEDIVMG